MINSLFRKLRNVENVSDINRYLLTKMYFNYLKFRGLLSIKFCKLFLGIDVGHNVKVWGRIDIYPAVGSLIKIGNNVSIVNSSSRCTAGPIYAPTKIRTHEKSASIVIDDGVGLNGTSIVARSKSIYIGKNTMIAPNVVIFDSDFHAVWPPDNRILNPCYESDQDIKIGYNCWIGTSCIIKKGVSIGNNSVVAAGSVVTKDIPGNTLSAGVPAKVLKSYNV